MHLGLHTGSSSRRTPTFIRHLLLCHARHREHPVQPIPSWKDSVCPKCVFSSLGHCGDHLSYGGKTQLSPCESRLFHSQTHLWKHLVLILSSLTTVNIYGQQVVFLKKHCAWISLQGCHLLKQSRVKKHCTVLEAPQREKPVHITSFMEKFCWFQVIISILEPYKEIHWVWICQLGTAGKKIVVTLWKQECFTFEPTW